MPLAEYKQFHNMQFPSDCVHRLDRTWTRSVVLNGFLLLVFTFFFC